MERAHETGDGQSVCLRVRRSPREAVERESRRVEQWRRIRRRRERASQRRAEHLLLLRIASKRENFKEIAASHAASEQGVFAQGREQISSETGSDSPIAPVAAPCYAALYSSLAVAASVRMLMSTIRLRQSRRCGSDKTS